MNKFLEQYGKALFTLVIISILISFALPIGMQIKNKIRTNVKSVDEITDDEIKIANGDYYTIVFDGNGATSGEMKPMKIICGKEFKMPECKFKKDGLVFSNVWISNKVYAVPNVTYKDIAKKGETVVFHAKWGSIFDLNGCLDGKIVGALTDYDNNEIYGTCDVYINDKLIDQNCVDFYDSYPYDTKYEIKNIKATKGHTYLGVVDNVPLLGYIRDDTVSPVLIFIRNKYTITYHSNAADAIGTTESSTHTYNKENTLTTNGFTRNGYTFIGWNTLKDGNGKVYKDKEIVKNLTDKNNKKIDLYAMWKKN